MFYDALFYRNCGQNLNGNIYPIPQKGLNKPNIIRVTINMCTVKKEPAKSFVFFKEI